jgi:hypothetical protein
MPIVNGAFVPEEQSVSNRVTGLISDDSTFIQRARTDAKKEANRRGLLNTSIAVQAGEEAAQKAALPIAAQEAEQAFRANISDQESQQQERSQELRFGQETAENIAQRTFQASETGLERAARAELLGTELESREREGLATRELQASEGLAQRELTASEGAATRQLQAAEGQAERDLNERLTLEGIFSNEMIAQLDADTKLRLVELDISSQQAIAAMQVDSAERQKATEAAVNMAAQYEHALATLISNPDLPADYRDEMMAHIAALRDSNFKMISGLHNIPLTWDSPSFSGFEDYGGGGGGGGGGGNAADDWSDYTFARGGLAQRAPRGSYFNGGLASLWRR